MKNKSKSTVRFSMIPKSYGNVPKMEEIRLFHHMTDTLSVSFLKLLILRFYVVTYLNHHRMWFMSNSLSRYVQGYVCMYTILK